MFGMRKMFLLAACLLLAACESAPDEAFPSRRPRESPSTERGPLIYLVGTMSGDDRRRGDDAYKGAVVGVQTMNRQARQNAFPFELIGLDDRGDADLAAELVEQAALDERAVGVIYAGPAEGLPPAAAALEQAGIPAITTYGDLYSAKLLRKNIFQVAPPLLWQARRLNSYLLGDRRYARVALLASKSLQGRTAVRSMRATFEATGRRRLFVHRYPADGEEFKSILRKMKRQRIEAVVIEGDNLTLLAVGHQLGQLGALYRTTAHARTVTAPRDAQGRIPRAFRGWRPQIAAFDEAIYPLQTGELPEGTVASDSYARGVFYLPVPSFIEFRRMFEAWEGAPPIGWERRGYEAARLIGWAARRSSGDEGPARTLELMSDRRFGGLDVSFGPDDHTTVDASTVGLWVIPKRGVADRDREHLPEGFPWVPLARGFSINGRTTDIPPGDWAVLFHDPPPPEGPGPRVTSARFGVATPRRDPVH
ncbi:MAG: ABC transporter substrate-binding protein [Actinomycetota bacterium]